MKIGDSVYKYNDIQNAAKKWATKIVSQKTTNGGGGRGATEGYFFLSCASIERQCLPKLWYDHLKSFIFR